VNGFNQLWKKLAKSKKYREEFVAAQVKRGIPFQIRTLLKKAGLSQEELAARAGLTQGVVSRAANPEYGNLTLNTIIRMAAGFDVAFIGKFVPFSELGRWFVNLSEDAISVPSFEDDRGFAERETAAHEHNTAVGVPITDAARHFAGVLTQIDGRLSVHIRDGKATVWRELGANKAQEVGTAESEEQFKQLLDTAASAASISSPTASWV